MNYQDTHLDQTFAAMGDPTRFAILSRLEPEGPLSVSELAKSFPVTLPAVMKHLGVLSEAGLIAREKTGRTVTVSLNPQPLLRVRLWLAPYERFWAPRLDRLAAHAEAMERRGSWRK